MLYPQSNAFRSRHSLDGLWRFAVIPSGQEPQSAIAAEPLRDAITMPVPASYNDLVQDVSLRDHVGWVWYQRDIHRPRGWDDGQIRLRFGAVAHHCIVYIDGVEVGRHKGGFLPFEFDVAANLMGHGSHMLTVAVDNRLDRSCLPVGELIPSSRPEEAGEVLQTIHFDFFNFSGIHREVELLWLPTGAIESVRLDAMCSQQQPSEQDDSGWINYFIECGGSLSEEITVVVSDADGAEVGRGKGRTGRIDLATVKRWGPGHPVLYQVEVTLQHSGVVVDCYVERVGFRTIAVDQGALLVNGQPVYLQGFGKHEDTVARGRAHDQVQMVKDYHLMDWIGANSYRTSHYPYHEDWLREADERGVLVIDETPAVGLWFVGNNDDHPFQADDPTTALRLEHHREVLAQLIQRDRNHPSVIMWSIANEPATWVPESRPYWDVLFQDARSSDPSRPLTVVECGDPVLANPNDSQVADLVDVVCLNRYPAWYFDVGRLETIVPSLTTDFEAWWHKTGKPIIITEYGADTIAGLHLDPPGIFSEEFQREFLARCHEVFDALPYVIGEHVWNFADFRTKQGLSRVDGNKKGIFTRDRQPKSAAFDLKLRWVQE